MGKADVLRIPAITVASGPMTVKIKKRHASLRFCRPTTRPTPRAYRQPLPQGRNSAGALPRMSQLHVTARRIRGSMNRTTLRQATGPISFVLIVLVCWFVAGMVADRVGQQELDAGFRQQRQMSTSIVDNNA